MKITDIKPYVVLVRRYLPWTFVEVHTDEGVTGLGECTNYTGTPMLVAGLEAVKRLLVGQDPSHIEEIWQRLFHTFSSMSNRGYISQLISGIDIALWDIRGKALGVPVYHLLGGPVRESVPLYTHIQDQRNRGVTIEDGVQRARETKQEGYEAIKTDPFKWQRPEDGPFRGAYMVERLSPRAIRESVEWLEAVREVVGPDYELLVECHGRFDVASATAAARAMEHINPIWYEEPVPAEDLEALQQVRENTRLPLCVGERHFTRWDYTQLFERRLVDYVMPDVSWCGGISEMRRIAALAETYGVRFSPHDAMGPVSIMAGFHVSMTAPNLYRQECVHRRFKDFARVITPMFDYHDGAIWPWDRPGLGVELDHEGIEEYTLDPWDEQASRFR